MFFLLIIFIEKCFTKNRQYTLRYISLSWLHWCHRKLTNAKLSYVSLTFDASNLTSYNLFFPKVLIWLFLILLHNECATNIRIVFIVWWRKEVRILNILRCWFYAIFVLGLFENKIPKYQMLEFLQLTKKIILWAIWSESKYLFTPFIFIYIRL